MTATMRKFKGNSNDYSSMDNKEDYGQTIHDLTFKEAIQQVEHYIDGHDYILEQVVDKDIYTVLHSIDEMVKSDNPIQVFEKYKHLYKKLSNTKKEHSYASNSFFG